MSRYQVELALRRMFQSGGMTDQEAEESSKRLASIMFEAILLEADDEPEAVKK